MSINQESKSSQIRKGIFFSLVLLTVSGIVTYIFYSGVFPKKAITEFNPEATKTEPAVAIVSIPEDFSLPTESPKFKIHLPEENNPSVKQPLPFHPPLPKLVQPPVVTKVNSSIGQDINTSHQTIIKIPPRAFVDKNGKVIEGEVKVSYKEYYNPIDIFLSGIPMNYDSGSSEQLVSAGMIEIAATHNNEPVFVNKENKINVMLAALSSESDYNIYYFNPKKQSWVYQGKDKIADSQGSRGKNGYFSDSVQVKTNFKYKEPEFSIELFSNSIMEEKRKSLFAKKRRPETFEFKLNPKRDSPEENKFIRSVRWSYTGEDAYENYCMLLTKPTRQYQSVVKKKWKDIRIERSESSDSYFLKASNDSVSISLEVKPSLKSKTAEAVFQKKFLAYTKGRENREEAQRLAYEKFVNDSIEYYRNGQYKIVRTSYSDAITRSFQIDGFGIWNCDRPANRPQGATVLAVFKDEKGNSIKPTNVYLVEKNSNTVYTYNEADFKKLKYNPSSENVMWTILPNGKFAYISSEEFKKYKTRGGTCVFTMKIDDVENPSRDHLKDKLKFS